MDSGAHRRSRCSNRCSNSSREANTRPLIQSFFRDHKSVFRPGMGIDPHGRPEHHCTAPTNRIPDCCRRCYNLGRIGRHRPQAIRRVGWSDRHWHDGWHASSTEAHPTHPTTNARTVHLRQAGQGQAAELGPCALHHRVEPILPALNPLGVMLLRDFDRLVSQELAHVLQGDSLFKEIAGERVS